MDREAGAGESGKTLDNDSYLTYRELSEKHLQVKTGRKRGSDKTHGEMVVNDIRDRFRKERK